MGSLSLCNFTEGQYSVHCSHLTNGVFLVGLFSAQSLQFIKHDFKCVSISLLAVYTSQPGLGQENWQEEM